jgi:hypothetical protein
MDVHLASPDTLRLPGRSPRDLAQFFVDNVCGSTDYISHREIACGRAVGPDEWSPDVFEVVRDEIQSAVHTPADMKRVWYGEEDGEVVGLAIVDLSGLPLASFDDLVVASGGRSEGRGIVFVRAVLSDIGTLPGVTGVTCKSGLANPRAHAFIQRIRFAPVSHVFYFDLRVTGRGTRRPVKRGQ